MKPWIGTAALAAGFLLGCARENGSEAARPSRGAVVSRDLSPLTLQVSRGSAEPASAGPLATRDQTASEEDYAKLVDFRPTARGLTATLDFVLPSGTDTSQSAELQVNFKGWDRAKQAWTFSALEPRTGKWIALGNNAAARRWEWSALAFAMPGALSRYVSQGVVKIRFWTTSGRENAFLDFVAIRASIASPDPSPTPPPSGTRVYGLTLDAVENTEAIRESLRRLSHRPTTRIVFDPRMPASYYAGPTKTIHEVAGTMGELLDSFAMKDITVAGYRDRAAEYFDGLGSWVDLWEIGNEINGEWLGASADVAAKMTAAYDLVKARGGKTALTLYYNESCWAKADHEMFAWVVAQVPERLRTGLDYVWVSYYEDDCNGAEPEWGPVFDRLGDLFPESKLGFGEIGTKFAERKSAFLNRYYSMAIAHPRYIGGYFWWYGRQDLVPWTSPYWSVFESLGRFF